MAKRKIVGAVANAVAGAELWYRADCPAGGTGRPSKVRDQAQSQEDKGQARRQEEGGEEDGPQGSIEDKSQGAKGRQETPGA